MIDINQYIGSVKVLSSWPNRRCCVTLSTRIKKPLQMITPFISYMEYITYITMDTGIESKVFYKIDDIIWKECYESEIAEGIKIHYKEGMKEKAEAIFKLYS